MKIEQVETREEIEQAAAAWIAQRDAGAWTQADANALREWLAKSVGRRAAYYRLNAAWTEAGRVRVLGHVVPASTALHPQQEATIQPSATLPYLPPVDKSQTPRKITPAFGIAAVIVVLLVAALATFQYKFVGAKTFTTVVGGLQAVPMSDGSHVILNTDTQLRISLTGRERLVDLERGEAFFEVARDPTRSFIVKAGGRRIIAIGTQFAVRRDMADLSVVVYEGTVRYEGDAAPAAAGRSAASPGDFLLAAGTVARTQGDSVLVQRGQTEEVERMLTWRNGYLTFRNTSLAEAAAQFNRYSNRKLVIEDPAIATLEVGGAFRVTNLDAFVRLLVRGFPIRATASADRIVLTSSSSRAGPVS